MKCITFLALFSTVLATACSKGADAAPPPTTPAPAANAPATPAANPAAAAPAVTPVTPAPAPAATPALKVPSVAELGSFLGNIKDGASATAAKEPLEALVKQLETAKGTAAPAAGTSGTSGALGGLGKAVSGAVSTAATKLGVSEGVQQQIGALLEKPEVKAAIGTTLEKLMAAVK